MDSKLVILPMIVAAVLVLGLGLSAQSQIATFDSADEKLSANDLGLAWDDDDNDGCPDDDKGDDHCDAKSLVIMGMVSESQIIAPATVTDAPFAQTQFNVGEGLVLPRDMMITKLVAFLNTDTLLCPSEVDNSCLTITVQKNGVDTSLVLKVPECPLLSQPCKSFGEVNGSVAFQKGDRIRFESVADGTGSTGVYSITVEGKG